jgi:hypothetical protein
MGTKDNPGDFDCYSNAETDETMFILLARDPDAPGLVEQWADAREKRGEDPVKVAEARECAASMRRWRALNRGPVVLYNGPCGTCLYCGQPRDIMVHEPSAATGHPWQPCCLLRTAHDESCKCLGWSEMPTSQPKKLDPGYEVTSSAEKHPDNASASAHDRLRRYAFAVSEDMIEQAREIAPDAVAFLSLLREAHPNDFDALIKAVRDMDCAQTPAQETPASE